jgi:SpoVK/Ycf46/Vps4 family AAA+-type ATPase
LLGEFNYLGSMKHNADRADEGAWEPQDPSFSQIRSTLTEYCVLPNGSPEVKAAMEKRMIKTLMLYGPSGSGKTHAVEAVAHELGALLIHLTPDKLRGTFPGKQGPTKLVHMCFAVARDPTMQPAIIYIDECEKFFTGGKKNKDKEGPSRFKKDFLTYKNQALGPEHRVIVIGTTKKPEDGDTKDMRGFFDRFLYLPYPDYASRCLIWRHYLHEKVREAVLKTEAMNAAAAISKGEAPAPSLSPDALSAKVQQICKTVDISMLAYISEGYSAGAIARTVRTVITPRRITLMGKRPLTNMDLDDNLSQQEVTFQDDKRAFLDFTRLIAGLDDRRKKIEAMVAGEADEGKDAKGKGAKKK